MTPDSSGTQSNAPLTRSQLASRARSLLESWSAGAQALALMNATHRAGWLPFLMEPRDLPALLELTQLPLQQLEDTLTALVAHGILDQEDGLAWEDRTIQLSAPFRALYAADAPVDVVDLLEYHLARPALIHEAVCDLEGTPMSEADALSQAKVFGGRVTPTSQNVFQRLMDALPEYVAVAERGRLLEVGCGVGGSLLTMATLFPHSQQVGLELLPSVAAEARRRAEDLGVADRVEIRCQDAQLLDEDRVYDAVFWAHPFFPLPTRPATLYAALRALRPGGLLLMQELFVAPPSDNEVANRSWSLSQLLFHHAGLPFTLTAEALSAEALATGYEEVRIAATPFGRMVVMRRPES